MDDQNSDSPTSTGWKFTNNEQQLNETEKAASGEAPIGSSSKGEALTWTAPDNYSQGKSFMWYLMLTIVGLVLSAIVYLLTKDKITTTVIVVCTILIGVYGGKKPRLINYKIDKAGINIGLHYYEFGRYRSFVVLDDLEHMSVALVPLHRFLPYTYVNCSAEVKDKFLSVLSAALPKSNKSRDPLERLLRKINF